MGAWIDFRPLRHAHFRRLWWGGELSTLGSQLTAVAVLFQMWQITADTAAVGALGIAQAVPRVIGGLAGGSLADAADRRAVALLATSGQLLTALLLAAQAWTGLESMWALLALAALSAGCSGLGAPARRVFTPRLLPADQVPAGVALDHVGFQVAMLVGPALAGGLIGAAGTTACYLLVAASFGAALHAIARLPSIRPDGRGTRPGLAAIRQGWRFVLGSRVLRGVFLNDVLATVLAFPIALFPAINAERFGGNPETLGLLMSALALGGLLGGLASGAVTSARRPGLVMVLAAGTWGVALVGFGLAQSPWVLLGCLTAAGAADTTSVICRGSIVLLATPDSHRGRVNAVDPVVGASGPDLGNFRAGLAADATSATAAAVSGALLCAVGVAVQGVRNRPLREFTAR
ncbi:MFS transporter [Saccharopolyspora griseoalba]|uniref:MFS transporter n=1 Tax=Saccharopolyspora griseoalba TaxID=1431848 RepID=A0ABW2LM42_9PSEU